MRKLFCLLSTAPLIVLLMACGGMAAEAPLEYPRGAVTMIIPFAPGGGVDVSGRMMGDALAKELGITIVIENIPGAAGIMGFNALAQRPADGQTVMVCGISSSAWVANVMSQAPLPWNANEDFQFLGRMNYQPSVYGLFVGSQSPYQTFPDLIRAIQANPGKFNAALQGPNSTAEPGHQELLNTFGLDVNIIYYADAAETQTAIMTGDVDYCYGGASRQSFIDNPNFNVLMLNNYTPPYDVWPVKGAPFLPDFQEELGFNYSDLKYIPMEAGGTFLAIKAGTDPRICELWTNAMKKICADEEYKKNVLTQSYMALFATPEESLKVHQDMAEAMRVFTAEQAARQQ